MSMDGKRSIDELRTRAEELVKMIPEPAQQQAALSLSELAQELAIHQQELQLQNEELTELHAALQQIKDQYQGLYQNAPAGYVVLDSVGVIRRANATFGRMVGQAGQDPCGRPFTDFLLAEDVSTFLGRFRTFFRNPAEKHIVVRLCGEGHRPFYARIESSVGFSLGKQADSTETSNPGLMVIVTDVGELKEAQARTEHLNNVLRSVKRVNRLVVSHQNSVQLINEVCESLTGNLGYFGVLIALVQNGESRLTAWANSGNHPAGPMPDAPTHLPAYLDRALVEEGFIISQGMMPASGLATGRAASPGLACMSHRLAYQGHIFGCISVTIPAAYATDQEGQELFRDLAADISAALFRIQTSQELHFATKELRATQSIFSVAMDHLQAGVAIADAPSGQLRYINRAGGFILTGQQDLPADTAELNRLASTWEFLDLDGGRLTRRSLPLLTSLGTGRVASREFFVRRPDGESRLIQSDAAPIKDASGNVVSAVVVFQDMTERRQGAERIELLGKMLDDAPASITIHDGEGNFLFANRQTLRLHGSQNESDFLHLGLRNVDVPDSSKLMKRRMEEIALHGEARFTVEHYKADGSKIPLDVLATAIRWNGRPAILSIATDLTAHKRAEAEVRRKENLLERVFNLLPIGLWFADRDGTLLRGNPAGVQIWGAEPHVSPKDYGIFKAWRLPSREPIRDGEWALARTIREKVAIQDELLEIEAFDGKRKTILNYTAPVLDDEGEVEAAVVVNLDISDRLSLEGQLAQAQKLESIGRLAGGVAHDFNNLLLGIMNCVELCRDQIGADHPIRIWLDEIMTDAQRSASLTRQLLGFARKQTIAPKVIDLNHTIGETLLMLRRLIGEDIDLRWTPAPHPQMVKMDRTQLDQILANICVNARDGIRGVGEVAISITTEDVGEAICKENLDASPGPYVRITVRDTGCGIPDEVLEHIFEPFFTTKPLGEGTGLGLSTVYGIVRQNGGFVTVQSQVSVGTTFNTFLPVCDERPEDSQEVSSPLSQPKGHGTLLLVEDEPGLRKTTRIFLQRAGYTVLEAESPLQALAMLEQNPCHVDMLITDVIMPGMNGVELRRTLSRTHPDLKCLLISGYSADLIANDGIDFNDSHFLGKPFSRDELISCVSEILRDKETDQ